ncbi:MAG: fasciclin domain-containing protein [Paracoccaceae bacterium]|uniref:fasciclin domain-containing protein n=1 Tax=Yoonia sp. TaxID=2212373 RepID=UPI0032760B67
MIHKTVLTSGAAIAIASTALASGTSNDKDIMNTVGESGNFSTFIDAVEMFGMADTLKAEGPFTILAPTNEAFAALPAETLEYLLSNPEALAQVLSNHVVYGNVMVDDLSNNMTAATANGSAVTFLLQDGVMVNDAHISSADIVASNGVIHAIDAVILPPR